MELPFCRSKIVEYRRFHMVQLTVCVVRWNRKFSSWKFYVCAVFSIQPPLASWVASRELLLLSYLRLSTCIWFSYQSTFLFSFCFQFSLSHNQSSRKHIFPVITESFVPLFVAKSPVIQHFKPFSSKIPSLNTAISIFHSSLEMGIHHQWPLLCSSHIPIINRETTNVYSFMHSFIHSFIYPSSQ